MRDRIERGCAEMGIGLPPGASDRLARYLELLTERNRTTNLAGDLGDPDEAVDRHILDSLSPIPSILPLNAATLADIGSGGGLPGIPLAIALPGLRVSLIESRRKKAEFLAEASGSLAPNADAVHMRAEDAAREPIHRGRYDVAVARAVADLFALVTYAFPLLRPGGTLIAYKGPAVRGELPEAEAKIAAFGGAITAAEPIRIPNREWDHLLVSIRKR